MFKLQTMGSGTPEVCFATSRKLAIPRLIVVLWYKVQEDDLP
jgi:hypothetical protein